MPFSGMPGRGGGINMAAVSVKRSVGSFSILAPAVNFLRDLLTKADQMGINSCHERRLCIQHCWI